MSQGDVLLARGAATKAFKQKTWQVPEAIHSRQHAVTLRRIASEGPDIGFTVG